MIKSLKNNMYELFLDKKKAENCGYILSCILFTFFIVVIPILFFMKDWAENS